MAVGTVVGVGTSVGVLTGEGTTGVNVSVGTGVSVSVGSGVRVKVGRKVFVGVRLGATVLVGVLVGVRDGVLVGVLVGVRVGVLVDVAASLGPRVRVGGRGVHVMKTLGVLDAVKVTEAVTVGEDVMVLVGIAVGVPTYPEIPSTVKAAIVLILEKAESTMSCGSMAALLGVRGSVKATAETTQNRLKPRAPIPRTVKGPEYFLILTRPLLLVIQLPVRTGFHETTIFDYYLLLIYPVNISIALWRHFESQGYNRFHANTYYLDLDRRSADCYFYTIVCALDICVASSGA